MTEEQKPGWLQTLWNVNSRIAEEAEKELTTLSEKPVKELREVVEQLKRSIYTLNGRFCKAEDSNFKTVYNQSIKFAIALYMADILTIETKIKLIENNQI